MKEIIIASAARTAIGNFNGALASLSAPEMGALELLKQWAETKSF